ncbi:MAG: CRTAC1 family protein, partial [Bacteroidetes bacterium]
WRFEDITEAAGVGGPEAGHWTTGATMADVDGDGWLDLYVSYFSGFMGQKGRHELFINQRDGTFREEAEAWGIARAGYGTQGVFFDYDRDGDLDLFQLNHSVHPASTVGDTSQRRWRDPLAGDRLYQQDNGRFVEVTEAARIFSSRLGYGLSAMATDVDGDGWTDLYVCNDFHEDDYLYLNQGDGTFREGLREKVGHTTRFSMGSDWSDLNQDGLPDLLTLDMKPEREAIRKTAEPPETWDVFQLKLRFGYYYQYPHNALQVSQGGGRFAELAQLAGVDATDWSWSALFADLDNDGREDLFITNGIYRRPNDMDYMKFISDPEVVRQLSGAPSAQDLAFIEQMPSIPLPNYLYRQAGELVFQNVAEAWGLAEPGFSNGAAYADLDRDGDLDLVVNNLEAPVSLYENRSRPRDSLHYIRLRLVGEGKNPYAIGARVWAWAGGAMQYRELQPVRGFLSSVEPVLHI